MRREFKKLIALMTSAVMIFPFFSEYPSDTFDIDWDLNWSASAADDLTTTIDTGASVTLSDSDGDDFYEIGTADELYAFASIVNGGYTDINAELTTDIVINSGDVADCAGVNAEGWREWTPIGNFITVFIGFKGTFDGQNHKISGLYFNNSEQDNVGFFGCTDTNAKIKNVGVVNSYFQGYSSVGGICGWNDSGTITGCYTTGTVTGTGEIISGVCGLNDHGTIKDCYTTGDVNGTGVYVGGVCGLNWGTVTCCYSTGTASGSKYVGAVCGYNINNTVENCYYNNSVYNGYAVGFNDGGLIEDVEGKSSEAFASGEVCYLLNGSTSEGEPAWGQIIAGEKAQAYPVISDDTVYYGYEHCQSTDKIYSNSKDAVHDEKTHGFKNGFCIGCDCYEEPENINDTYQIGNAGELYWFGEYANTNDASPNAVLTADIVVNEGDVSGCNGTKADGWREWLPIEMYSGTFNGQNHTISGLYCNRSQEQHVGLFGYIKKDGIIKNVGIVNSYFRGSRFVGGVCGENASSIGVIGTIENCYNESTVVGLTEIGGVCGYSNNHSTIENCYNKGSIKGNINVGGVCGSAYYAVVTNCHNTGTVTGTVTEDSYNIGGVCGKNGDGTVINCHNTGTVTATGNSVGGVCGENNYSGAIRKCYNEGTISGRNHVGGVCGYNCEIIMNCYNKGTVSGNDNISGLCGYSGGSGEITYCYNKGNVSGNNNVGSLCGFKEYGGITDCYYLDETCSAGIGSGVGVIEMKTADQFASGEVCYILQGQQTEKIWGQILTGENKQAYPVLSDDTVYYGYENCLSKEKIYSNIELNTEKSEHSLTEDSNGFCTLCGGYEQPDINEYTGTYYIGNAGELYWFAEYVNAGNIYEDAVLTADITVNSGNLSGYNGTDEVDWRTWIPIGNNPNGYEGTFDGQNYTISGLYLNDKNTSYAGLFGYAGKYGEIRNIGIVNSYFSGKDYVGCVCGENYGIITNCYNKGTISGSENVGGVCGKNHKRIANCYNTGTISGNNDIGGVCGSNIGAITNCYYLYGTCSTGIGSGDGSAEVKTANRFASGEIAYSLSQGSKIDSVPYPGDVWGQNIDKEAPYDASPVLGGEKVYKGYNECVEAYSNSELSDAPREHVYDENGLCIVCGQDESGAVSLGDANNDGKVNVADAAYIARILAKLQIIDVKDNPAADFNGDGKVSVSDAAAIARHLAKVYGVRFNYS